MANVLVVTRLQATIAALAPIDGLSVPTFGNSATVRIDFKASATGPQRTAAQNALTAFDWSDAAQAAYDAAQLDAREPNRSPLLAAAQNALDGNTTYLAIGSPTNAQAVAQVGALTQQMNKVIRYLIDIA